MLVHDQGKGPTIPVMSHHTPTSGPSISQPPSTPPSIQTTHVAEEAAPMPHDSPLPRVHSLGSDEGSLSLYELTTYSTALTKLIKRVKKLEQTIKTSQARRRAEVVISDAEEDEEDPSKQGRSLIEEMDLDAGISLVPPHVADQGRFDDTQVSDQPKEQLGVFSAAKVLADAAEQKKDVENVQTYTRRRRAVSTGSGGVSTASELVSIAGVKAKDKGKAVMQESEPPKKIKKRVQVQMSIDEELAQKVLENHQQSKFHGEVISQEDANYTSSTNEAVNTAHDVSTANLEQIDTDDLEREWISNGRWLWLNHEGEEILKKTGINLNFNSKETVSFDKTKCVYSREVCDDSTVNDRFKTCEGFHAVPSPYTENYMPSRPDLSFVGLDDFVYKTKDTDSDNDSVFRPKTDQTKPKFTKINFVKSDENVKSVNKENTHKQVEYPRKSQSPMAVTTKLGQVPVNAAKQNSPRAAASISTVRPVNNVTPKSKVNDALPKTYSYFKAHSLVRRDFNQKSVAKTYNLNEKVKTARVNNVTTVVPKVVVSAAVRYGGKCC
ncbi:hypothetical protein Tco_0891971 [Tanacetum coccineum]|uniref:Uncharacterized protein n=1 Tax=Tanacetum coccineum TaxID=301880 RepID=A0ABQ5C9W7_9ASTR